MLAVLETLTSALSTDDDVYQYDCRVCGTRFESDERTVDTVSCPDCGLRSLSDWLPES
ncbi:hypothetical protein [Haloarchaeobius sp. DT45]|uniref:hypothetical protein n=1 Tax=Haloarchaeobius sp. DT45 TaxID=3446116 RepID=UPI003F6CE9FB